MAFSADYKVTLFPDPAFAPRTVSVLLTCCLPVGLLAILSEASALAGGGYCVGTYHHGQTGSKAESAFDPGGTATSIAVLAGYGLVSNAPGGGLAQ